MSGSKKQQTEQYLAGILCVVFALLLFRSFSQKKPSTVRPLASEPSAKKETLLPGLIKNHYQKIDDAALESAVGSAKPVFSGYSAHKLRDPFKNLLPVEPPKTAKSNGSRASSVKPIAERPIVPPKLSLAGVWWTEDHPAALINGRVYHSGEAVEGATVKEISTEGVVLEFSGKPFLLTLSGIRGFGQSQEVATAYGRR